jgi:hypothetical protein
MRGKDVVGKLRRTMERVEELPSQDFDELREKKKQIALKKEHI